MICSSGAPHHRVAAPKRREWVERGQLCAGTAQLGLPQGDAMRQARGRAARQVVEQLAVAAQAAGRRLLLQPELQAIAGHMCVVEPYTYGRRHPLGHQLGRAGQLGHIGG